MPETAGKCNENLFANSQIANGQLGYFASAQDFF
jgi:hypothetical protein